MDERGRKSSTSRGARCAGVQGLVALAVAPLGAILAWAPPADAAAARPGTAAQSHIERVQKKLAEAGLDAQLVAQPLGEARRAVRRARGARESGDGVHAPMLERLAVEWAQMAAATVRAAQAEARADGDSKRSRDLRSKLERARALLTELQARRGRLQAEVRKAEQLATAKRRKAADAETRRLDKAAGKRPKRRKGAAPGGDARKVPARPGKGPARPGGKR